MGEVFPEIVAYEENGIDAKSIDYARLVSVLIEATKEQQKLIGSLQKDNISLKGELEKMKNVEARLQKIETLLQGVGSPQIQNQEKK